MNATQKIRAVTQAAARAAEPTPPPAAPPEIGQVAPGKLKLLQYTNNEWTGFAPKGCRAEDLHLHPDAFALLPNQVARFDTLRLIDPDDRWIGWYLCVEKLTGHSIFVLLKAVDLPAREGNSSDRIPPGYEIVQGGPEDIEGFLVRRLSDNVVMNRHRRTPTKEDAIRFLLDHASVRGETHQTVY